MRDDRYGEKDRDYCLIRFHEYDHTIITRHSAGPCPALICKTVGIYHLTV